MIDYTINNEDSDNLKLIYYNFKMLQDKLLGNFNYTVTLNI